MQELVIDRTKWRTGDWDSNMTGKGETRLLNEEGYMCCLGFECLRRGLSEEQILNVGEPQEVNEDLYPKLGDMLKEDGYQDRWIHKAIDINDDYATTLQEKEEALEKLFAERGIEVKFIN